MSPTLEPGDRLLVDRAAYRTEPPRPGDIVVLRDPEGSSAFRVKRIGRPPEATPPDAVWIEGENAEASRDSRQFGPVLRSLIVGRVWYRYAPREREGALG